MANFTETSVFTAGIYVKETSDPVLGGSQTAPANLPEGQLTNRTRYLLDRLEAGGVEFSASESTNVNNLTKSGFHSVLQTAANRPPNTLNGYVIVVNNASTLAAQVWISQDSNRMYMRRIVAGPTFTDWVSINVAGVYDQTFTVNSFLNSWAAAPGSAVVFERNGQMVHVRGRLQSGQTNLPLFSIDPALWPSEAKQVPVASSDGSIWVFTILPDGSTSVSDGGPQVAFPGVLNFSFNYRV